MKQLLLNKDGSIKIQDYELPHILPYFKIPVFNPVPSPTYGELCQNCQYKVQIKEVLYKLIGKSTRYAIYEEVIP